MDERRQFTEYLVQLTRLALTGRRQDIELFARRIARSLKQSDPEAAQKITALLQELPTRTSPLRNANMATVPVDKDSRLELIRSEFPTEPEVAPIFEPAIRRQLDQIVSERKKLAELEQAGLSPSKAVLFTGAPGVGKTFAARMVANALGLPLLTLDLSAVMSSFLGRTGTNIRNVFDYAKGTPCVLLLDELDAVAKKRNDAIEVGELKRLVTVLLQEIDDWPSSNLLIAATNHPELLDPAIWRRFDVLIEFPLPDATYAQKAAELYLGESAKEVREWIPVIAKLLNGLSYSDIARELTRLRRISVLEKQSLSETLDDFIRNRAQGLNHSERIKLATDLATLGEFSQRRIQELTGVSRDTIRKHSGELSN